MKYIVVVLFFLIMSSSNAANLEKKLSSSNIPVHITADKLVAFDKKGLYKFSGNVVATRKDVKLTAANMVVKKNIKTGKIIQIVCTKNVVITKENKTAKGDKAIYENLLDRVTLIGNASVTSDKNKITSDKIIYYINKDYAISQSDNGKKRVSVTIYPDKKKEKK